MIKSITVTNYLGESVKIVLTDDEPKHGLLLKSMEGLGPAKADINTTSFGTSDGSIFNFARLDKRNITISFYFWGDIEEARNLTYKYFPIRKNVELVIETTQKTVRTSGWVESNEPDIFSPQESNNISIICPDPYFYDAGPNAINRTIFSGTVSLFTFPFQSPISAKIIPSIENSNGIVIEDSDGEPLSGIASYGSVKKFKFGEIYSHPSRIIKYDGEFETGIIIRLHMLDTVKNITIYETKRRQIFKLNGTFQSSDDVIIDTKQGEKSVYLYRNGSITNLLNSVDIGSSWFKLIKGDNNFSYASEVGQEMIEMTIENETVREGV